jgi:hypothetical protein
VKGLELSSNASSPVAALIQSSSRDSVFNSSMEDIGHPTDRFSGYRNWTARSGTLIANMLMAAGQN